MPSDKPGMNFYQTEKKTWQKTKKRSRITTVTDKGSEQDRQAGLSQEGHYYDQ